MNLLVGLVYAVFVAVLLTWVDAQIVKSEKAQRMGARERLLRSESRGRQPLTILVHSIFLPLVCVIRGHEQDFAAFEPIVFCKRCRRAVLVA